MISIIIPVYNEGILLHEIISRLKAMDAEKQLQEIIVVDGGSTDNTMQVATSAGAFVIQSAKGRAVQMNAGAAIARGSILYFLHADTLPPHNYTSLITSAFRQGYAIGCFRLAFDVKHWFLEANAWFTRFNVNAFRFGDQSLFVENNLFHKAGGFDEKHIILEDQEIITRLRKTGKFIVLPYAVTTSSRKYVANGIYKTQAIYFLIYFLYRLGMSQHRMIKLYKQLIRQDKL